MSHFTTISIEIKNGDLLEKALHKLGYQVNTNTIVRGYLGDTTNAEYVIPMPNAYDIGFRKLGECYELIADMWGIALNLKEFLGDLNQQYASETVLQSATQQGFSIEEQEILDDGTVRIVIARWG